MCVDCCCSFYLFCFFFFSSRRRHTRCLSDWSSDVCSSDLTRRSSRRESGAAPAGRRAPTIRCSSGCSRSEERREGKSVDLGGRRIIKKKKKKTNKNTQK